MHRRRFPVFGYGCHRGSALGGASREVRFGEDDGPEVATLFDEGASIIHAETWLKEWDGAAARNPETSGPVYTAILEALRSSSTSRTSLFAIGRYGCWKTGQPRRSASPR